VFAVHRPSFPLRYKLVQSFEISEDGLESVVLWRIYQLIYSAPGVLYFLTSIATLSYFLFITRSVPVYLPLSHFFLPSHASCLTLEISSVSFFCIHKMIFTFIIHTLL